MAVAVTAVVLKTASNSLRVVWDPTLASNSGFVLPVQTGTVFLILQIFVLFDLILYVPSTIFQLNRDGSS